MSDYTPSMHYFRRQFANRYTHEADVIAAEERFDRALAAHDAEVLREAADALDETIQGLNRENPLELAYINCTRIDAQELRHRAARIESSET